MRQLAFVMIAACASQPLAPATPDYHPIVGDPAPAVASLYTDCLSDAISNHRVRRATDPDTTLLLFTCTGAAAGGMFDGLAAWSAKIGSQFESAGRTFRSTARVRHDLFGVDYCARGGGADECVLTINVGPVAR